MATEEEPGLSEQVQSYLDKHKISSLFEDLKSKIIKDLPANPIEFVISKLQALQKQKTKATASRPATSSGGSSSKTRIQVTGTTAPTTASKLKSPSGPKAKTGLSSTSSPSLAKPRPTSAGTKTSGATKPTSAGAKLKPPSSTSSLKRPTTAPASASKGPASKAPASKGPASKGPASPASKGPLSPAGSKSSLSSSKSSGLRTPSKLSTNSSTKSTPAKTPSRSGGLKPPGATGTPKATPGTGKKVVPSTTKDKLRSPTKRPVSAQAATKSTTATKTEPKVKTDASSKKIDEFFGESKKPSVSLSPLHHDNDEGGVESDCEDSVRGVESEGEESVRDEDTQSPGVNLESLLQMKMSTKQSKSKRSPKRAKAHLSPREEDLSTTPPSLGYHSEDWEESEDECVEAVEDQAALEEEGVTGLSGATKLPKDSKVNFVVILCSSCAKMLTGEEPVSDMSAIVVTKGAGSDFESASQVGSSVSFPQWEVGTETDSTASVADQWKSSSDVSSNVTLVSRDTWGGLAPKTRPLPSSSETESEVQLPPPPPLEGRPWREESPHNLHGWAEQS